MADRASAIIVLKRHLLLIHRIREERDFYVFPGGHIEAGESAEQACIREVFEETGLHTAWVQPAFEYTEPARKAHYFFIQPQPGIVAFNGPEMKKQSEKNRYLLEWVPLQQVSGINLQPAGVRDAIARVIAEDGVVREARDLALRGERLQMFLKANDAG